MTLWFAYLHKYGNIVVKEWYAGNSYLREAMGSPYVIRYLEKPFEASSREEAEEIAKTMLTEK